MRAEVWGLKTHISELMYPEKSYAFY